MERKLAAILYADVVGYSRLTGLNEEETHRKLDTGLNLLTEAISAHGGKKIHEAGDAILAEFQSVTVAVNSAVEFQQQMAMCNKDLPDDEQLQFRVGINLGEVIHDRDDIYGDDVNLAARIQELADPGGVCISGAVFEQVNGKVDQAFDDLGYRKVKNIAQSVRVYQMHASEKLKGIESQSLFVRKVIDEASLITGRCMCNDVRYEISEPAIGTGLCHCRMCQRFTSAPFAAWAVFAPEAVRFTNTEPKYYESSPIAERGFCSKCGSSLTMRYYPQEPSDILAILVMTLDHPEDFAPTRHMCVESRVPWLDLHDDLPGGRSPESQNLLKRWGAVGMLDPDDWKSEADQQFE